LTKQITVKLADCKSKWPQLQNGALDGERCHTPYTSVEVFVIVASLS